MGDKATLAKARKELEDMYEGIPDDSVNLTFQDFAELSISTTADVERKPSHSLKPISELKSNPMAKLPSLDFNRALQASKNNHRINNEDITPCRGNMNNHQHHLGVNGHGGHTGHGDPRCGGFDDHHHGHNFHHHHHHHMMSSHHGGVEMSSISMASTAYDHHDVSGVSMASTAMNQQQDRGGRRRPGVPHSNICTICSTYIYIFRHRCLVCGRVYCRQCVMLGMGEMIEGRKCVECLGKRFSQRYIQRAGKVGCCSRYPGEVKQAELKWAEKGPRRNSRNGPYGRSTVGTPRSRSPVTPRTPRTPIRGHVPGSPGSNAFVTSSSYSPYSSGHHHFPF